jgi:hypothetical protein
MSESIGSKNYQCLFFSVWFCLTPWKEVIANGKESSEEGQEGDQEGREEGQEDSQEEMNRTCRRGPPGGLSALARRGNPTFAAGAIATAAPVAVFLRTLLRT